ncbi:GNAT family N-acetyltransferase [Rahnella sp. SAP-1]|uniref:GNAT family N-acetyltransferase n=1 Tax=Rouxiella aceris TaxID=2703884 RepID=A0A848MI18_9GAMM|nr:GNAT family protein [Rouxiella aceris]NMP25994.1 GNAT family N-acetyltransferase [Rouxiella aceris]
MTNINHFGQPVGDELANNQPRKRPERRTLEGHYCQLEPLDCDKHSESLFTAWHSIDDERDWTYFSINRPATQADCNSYISHISRLEDPLYFAVVDQRTRRAIGGVSLMRIDAVNGVAEIGWVNWSPLMKRSRFGTEAIFLLLSYLFDTLDYRRCEWKCHSLNEASNLAARRFGFQYEGTFRQALISKGLNRDTCWYSMLDHEWPAIKTAFQQWLGEENFDADGIQKQKLEAFQTADKVRD